MQRMGSRRSVSTAPPEPMAVCVCASGLAGRASVEFVFCPADKETFA